MGPRRLDHQDEQRKQRTIERYAGFPNHQLGHTWGRLMTLMNVDKASFNGPDLVGYV